MGIDGDQVHPATPAAPAGPSIVPALTHPSAEVPVEEPVDESAAVAPEPDGPPRRGGPPWRDDPDWRPGPSWAYRRRNQYGTLFLPIFVLVVELVAVQLANYHRHEGRPLDTVGNLLIVLGVLPLVVRIRWRIPTYVVSLGATLAYIIAGYPYGPVFLAVLVSIFGAVRTGHRMGVWISTAIGYVIFVVLGRIVPTIGGVHLRVPSLATAIGVAAWIIVALAVAEGFRVRTERFAEIARTHAEQARARAEQKRRQESEERLRIAQELHDVLGHHLSLINVQAGVGLHLMDENPGQARVALEAIKQASAAALGEVRSVLGVLRTTEEAAPRSPAPTLANLASLADPSDTVVVGTPVELPPEVDRAAFRIIQESLTNVRRHAGEGAHASVAITYQPMALVVRVADDGRGAPGWVGAAARPSAQASAGSRAQASGASRAEASGASRATASDAFRAPASGASRVATSASARTATSGAASGRGGTTASPPGESGNGIAGMRARAVALGGSLTAGPGPSGGFVVTATLPLRQVP